MMMCFKKYWIDGLLDLNYDIICLFIRVCLITKEKGIGAHIIVSLKMCCMGRNANWLIDWLINRF